MRWSNYTRVVFISFHSLFVQSYSATYLYSYMPSLTMWCGYKQQDKAFYTSIVVSLFSIASAITSYPLGLLSDKYGHRYIITFLLIENAICNISMAFSQNMTAILISRFLTGVAQNIFPLSRAILKPFCNAANQPRAMAINQTGWIMGLMLGSVCGGYLAAVSVKYPKIFEYSDFFQKFPYALPPLIGACLSITSAILTFTLYPRENSNDDHQSELNDNREQQIIHVNGHLCEQSYSTFEDSPATTSGENLDSNTEKNVTTEEHMHDFEELSTNRFVNRLRIWYKKTKNTPIVRSITNVNIRKSIIALALLQATVQAYIEFFSVWASTTRNLGGLNYNTNDIGSITTTVLIPCCIAQLILYPLLEKRIGSRKCYMIAMILMLISTNSTAVTRLITSTHTTWITLVLLQFFFLFAEGFGCSAILVLLNNSIDNHEAGAIFGIANMFYTGNAIVMPLIAGGIFTWSVTANIGSPIDTSLAFVFMGFNFFLSAALVYSLPWRLDGQAHIMELEIQHKKVLETPNESKT